MRKRIILLLATLVVMLIMTACGHNCEKDGHIWVGDICETYQICEECNMQGGLVEHTWGTEVCETYQTCEKCGTQGEYISHQWVGDTCEAYQTCEKCGEQGGEYISHHWVGYTCETYQTCEKCGEQGKFIDHYLDDYGICIMCEENIGIELTDENIEQYIDVGVGFVPCGIVWSEDGRLVLKYILRVYSNEKYAKVENVQLWFSTNIGGLYEPPNNIPIYGLSLNYEEEHFDGVEIPFTTLDTVVYYENGNWIGCPFDELPAYTDFYNLGESTCPLDDITIHMNGVGHLYFKEPESSSLRESIRMKERQRIIDENS